MGMRHARQHSAADDNQRNTPRTALRCGATLEQYLCEAKTSGRFLA
jgi:hypothetical protein